MTAYNKLVRDKIPEILDRKGVVYEKRIASPEEYVVELYKKLQEEVAEFTSAESPEARVEELADVLEVLDALKMLPEYATVEEVQRQKRIERGGFAERSILTGEKE